MRARAAALVVPAILGGILLAACGGGPVAPPPPEAPVIACPADVLAPGLSGGAGEVSYPAPAVAGGVQPITVSCAPASGSRFTAGTTTVGCVATDARGRQAACSFGVTVTARRLDATRFIAFGDSITEGENGRPAFIDPPHLYPTQLEALLNAEYPGQGIVVLNRGIGGASVKRGVEALPGVLAADAGDALLLLNGYNDLLADCRPERAGFASCSRAIDDVVAGLRQCVRIAREPGRSIRYVLVSTLTPPGPFVGGPRDRRIAAEAIVRVNAGIADMVRAEGAILVDAWTRFAGREAEYVDQDGLHLRPAGYLALAQAFFDAIRERVPSIPAARSR